MALMAFPRGDVVTEPVVYLADIGKLHFAVLNSKQRQWQSLLAIKCVCAVQEQWCQNELSEEIYAKLLKLLFQWDFSFRLSFSD